MEITKKTLNTILPASAFACTLALALTSTTAQALPATVHDNYMGGDDHGWGDVIGSQWQFNTHSMSVDKIGKTLSVSIHTNFAGRGDDGLYSWVTAGGKGIGYGDLFLSSSWNPYGSAPYQYDNNQNGTVWSYGFSLDDRWMHESNAGTGTLYSLNSGNNNTDALLSDDFLTGGTFRNGQEIAVDTDSDGVAAVANNSSSWSIDKGAKRINFLIDLTGTDLANAEEIALHWGMSCGNDTIEGIVDVPEPGIIALIAAGLAGFGLVGVRRKRK